LFNDLSVPWLAQRLGAKKIPWEKCKYFPGKKLSISREIIMENVNEKQIDWLFKERG